MVRFFFCRVYNLNNGRIVQLSVSVGVGKGRERGIAVHILLSIKVGSVCFLI